MSLFRAVLTAISLVAFVAMVGVFLLVKNHWATAERQAVYQLDHDFKTVRRILIKPDVLEQIISRQQGELVSRQWHDLSFSSDRLLSGWRVNGDGEFVVKATDEEVGNMLLRFRQKVHVSDERIHSLTTLAGPVGPVQAIETELVITPSGEHSEVHARVKLVYRRKIPVQYFETMDRRVAEATEAMLERNRAAIIDLVDQGIDNGKFHIQINGRKSRRARRQSR